MQTATTFILVRHAEKAPAAADAEFYLSEAGQARAKELARVLGNAPVSAIYTTRALRTQETVAPLAAALKITPVPVDAGPADYAANLVRDLLAKHKGETVVVAGHSDTTVAVLRALGVEKPPFIYEHNFDYLFVCTVGDELPASCVTLRYGASTP